MTDAEPPAPPDPMSASTPMRERLIAAALDGLRHLTHVDLVGAVGSREIARRAGASPANINHHFGSLSGLADAVLARVFDPVSAPVDGINALVARIEDSHLPLEAAFALHGAEFDRLTSDPNLPLRMGLWSLGGPDGVAAYRRYLRTIDEALVETSERLFSSWGRRVRPPYDQLSYLAVKVALVNGNAYRQWVDPTPHRRSMFIRASVALDLVLLGVESDTHDVDERLSELNYYPVIKPRETARQPRSSQSRARILHAAAELFSARGYDGVTLDRIARHANVSTSTLNRHYRTRAEIAIALFRQQATDRLADPAEEPPAPGSDPGIVAYLASLAEFVFSRDYARAYLAAVLLPEPDTALATDGILATAERLIQRAVDPTASPAGGLVEGPDAALLVALVIRRALQRRDENPVAIARYAWGVFTAGVLSLDGANGPGGADPAIGAGDAGERRHDPLSRHDNGTITS